MASGPEDDAGEKLSLYCRDWCGACMIVVRVIERLGLDVEIRNVFENAAYYDELLAARGRGTVPVLRRDLADGSTVWLPESRDIIAYLSTRRALADSS